MKRIFTVISIFFAVQLAEAQPAVEGKPVEQPAAKMATEAPAAGAQPAAAQAQEQQQPAEKQKRATAQTKPQAETQPTKTLRAKAWIEKAQQKGPLEGCAWGVVARDRDGKVIVSHNGGQRLVPASNLKLVTTGTALHAFNPDYRFETGIGYTGTINEGTLEGDVYIIGGGDPTIGAKDSIAYKADALFWKWKQLLKSAGIDRINGRIIGDGSAWEGHLEHASWQYDDMGTYYGTGSNALCFCQNAIDLEVSAAEEGQPVNARQTYPETPWMHFTNQSITGPAGTGNSLYLFTTDLAPYSELRGSFATDRKPKTEHFANKYGALTCAYYFWRNLKTTGWEVSGQYADIDRNGYIREADFIPRETAENPTLIGTTQSPALKEIAKITNFRSDNFYAEAMLRAMGEAATEMAVYDSCLVAQDVVLKALGLSTEKIAHYDGSGLSAMNRVSPEWMADFLDAMKGSPAFKDFLETIPMPGEGTLWAVKVKNAEKIRMKSGSMTGVLCYSGYILGDDGLPDITFSFLVNGAVTTPSQLRQAMTELIGILTE